MREPQRSLSAIAWAVAILVLVGGYARIELREVRRVGVAESEAGALRTRIGRSQAILRNRVALQAARKNIVSDIGAQARYDGDGDGDLGSLLAALDRAAGRSKLAILAVEPDGAAGIRSNRDWLRARAVKIVVRGTFSRFLAFLPELSTVDPLLQVRDVAIVPVGKTDVAPVLVFTLGVSAYTVRAAATEE